VRSTKVRPRNQGRTTTKVDAEEWEHCLGQRQGMGALPRPTPRNGSTTKADAEESRTARLTPRNESTAKADADEWEHC
jgi:hypothetical protein